MKGVMADISTYVICRVCLKPADIKIVREQQNALVMEGKHDDGSVHTWLKYKTMLLNIEKEKTDWIMCPRCKKKGKVNEFRPNARDPFKTAYVVKHERMPKTAGTWGKQKMQKMRRCFIRDKKMMNEIDKQLGRYVV